MKHLLRFVLIASTVLSSLIAVSAIPPPADELLVKVLNNEELTKLNRAMDVPPVKFPCREEKHYKKVHNIMKGKGEGDLFDKPFINANTVKHWVLILGPEGNGLTAALSIAAYLMKLNGETPVILPIKITVFFVQFYGPEGGTDLAKLLLIVKDLVADYKEYPRYLALYGMNRIIKEERTIIVDGQVGSGLRGNLFCEAEEAVLIIEILKKAGAEVLGHDGRSFFKSDTKNFFDKKINISAANFVINTFRVQQDQSSEGLVVTEISHAAMKTFIGNPNFGTNPTPTDNGITVSYVELDTKFNCVLLENPFASFGAFKRVLDLIQVNIYEPVCTNKV